MGKIKKIVDGVVVEIDDTQMVRTVENGVVVERPLNQTLKKKVETPSEGFLGGVAAGLSGGQLPEKQKISAIGGQAGQLAPKDNLKGIDRLDRDINNIFNNYQAVKVTKLPINAGGDFYDKKKIAPIDINDNAAIGQLISEINQADYLEGTSKGQKQEFIQALNTRALYNTAKQGITPTINQLGKQVNEAVVRNIIESERGEDKKSSVKDDEQKINHFKWGLSHIEKTDPARFNNVIATISQLKKVPESDFYALSTIGQEIENAVKKKSAVINPEWEGEVTQFDYTTFGQKKAVAASKVGERLKSEGYKNQNRFTEKQIREAAEKEGIKNKDIVDELVTDENLLFYDAIPKSGWMDDVAAGIMQPLSGVKRTIQTLGESPAETYLRSQRLDEGIGGQKVPDEKGQYSDILPSEREDWKTGAFRGAGQLLTNIAFARGFGGIGNKVLGSSLNAAQKANMINYFGTGFSTYLQTYGQEYEDALRRTGNPEKAKLLATIDSAFTAGWEMLLPDVKIASESFDGIKRALGEQLQSVVNKGGSAQQMAKEARPFIERAVANISTIWGKEIAEELGTNFTDYMTEMVFSPKTGKERKLSDEMTRTLKEAATATAIPAVVGGGASSLQNVIEEESNREKLIQTAKESAKNLGELYRVGFEQNPEASLKEVAQQLNASESEAKTARRIYGDEISDIALELFPNEKVETSEGMQELLNQPEIETTQTEEIIPEGVQEQASTVSGKEGGRGVDVAKMSDVDIENRLTEIQDKGGKTTEQEDREFDTLEKEMQKRERAMVFNVPLSEAKGAIDALMKKEKEMPNGWGSFLERRDASESKQVIDDYLNAKDISDAQLKKDFKDALMGRPATWYADGLKLRESMKEAANRGIDINDMLKEVEIEFTKDGYDIKTAKEMVAYYLKPIFEGSQKVETDLSKQLSTQEAKQEPTVSEVGDEKIETNEVTQEATPSPEPISPITESQTTEGIAEPPSPPTEGEGVASEEDGEKPSGIKKALVSDEIIKGVDLEKVSDSEMMAMGRKIIDTGEVKPEAIVTKIITEGKGVLTPTEVVAMITYKADIDNALRKAYEEFNAKKEAGEDIGTLGVEIADLERQVNDFDVMAVITAQQQSMAFRLRQKMLDRNYNVVAQIEKYKSKNNGYIPPEVEAKFRELGKQLDEVKAKLAEAEKKASEKDGQQAVENIKESVGRETKLTEEELDKKVQEGIEKEISKLYEQLSPEKKSLADKAIAALEKFRTKLKGGGRNYDATLGIPIYIIDKGAAVAIRAIKVGRTVAQAVKIGIKTIKDGLKEKGIDVKDWESKIEKDLTEFLEAEGVSTKPVKDTPTINEDGTVSIPNQMIRDLVSKGITDINDLTDAVHKEVVKDLPDITKRQVRDYITGYGKTVNPTADDVQQQVNTAKRVGRLLSELEDLQNKKAKTKNPESRNKITEKEREIKRKIRVLEKEAGITETIEEKNIKRLQSKLDDLLSGNVSNTKEARELSDAEKDLNNKIAEAKKNLGLIRSKTVKTDTSLGLEDLEAKEQRKIKALEKQLDELRAGIVKQKAEKAKDSDEVKDLKEQIFEEKRKIGLIKPKATPSTPNQLKITETEKKIQRLEKEKSDLEVGIVKQKNVSNEKPSPAQKEKIDNLNDEIFELKKNLGLIRSKEIKVEKVLTDEERLELAKKRVKDRIAELERKIKNKDFAKKKKIPEKKDDELVLLEAQKEKLQQEFDNEQYKVELKNRNWVKKLEDVAIEVFSGVVRGLVASFDVSAAFVQGMYRLFVDTGKSVIELAQLKKPSPNRSFNAVGTMFRALFSQKFADDYLNKIKSSEAYPLMQASKLAIDDKSGHVSAKEGLFISNWVNLIYDKVVAPALSIPISVFAKGNVRKAYDIAKAINPYLASQRAFDGYVNAVRVNSFKDFAKYLEKSGHTFESDDKVFKKAADIINTTTGRGSLGAADASSKWLNIFLFAPRKVISEVKLFTPYAFLYYAKLPKPVRIKALKDLATFLGAFTAANALLWASSKPDEDDEEEMKRWWDFWNLNSSNFLTHKIGGKRVSIGGGAKSMLTFQARLASGKFVDQYGNETKLGDRFGKQINTRFDLITNFIAGKTSPVFNVAIKKAQERKNLEVDNADMIKNLTVPIWMQDLKDLYREDPASVNIILTALTLLGANVRAIDDGNKRSSFTDEDKKDPTFKYFLDKGMNLPNVVPASIDVPDKATKTIKNLTDYPEEKIKEYQDEHKKFLKAELKEVKDKGYVYEDAYENISTDYERPPKGYSKEKIDNLTKVQLAKVLKSAQSSATEKTKNKLFPK